MTRIVIIGGGIAGLAAAYYANKNIPDAQITVAEADSHWGGKIITDPVVFHDSQFIIEGGPDSFLATKPWGVGLCEELGLGERLERTNLNLKNTYILKKGRLLPIPEGLAMMIPSDIGSLLRSGLISWFGKLRLGLDFLLPANKVNGDESLGGFISRRLGREAYENLIEPLMSGIYAGDGNQLSLASTFPYLRDLERKHGSLVRGALQIRSQSNGKSVLGSRSAFLTLTGGLAEMVEKLVERLTVNQAVLRLNSRATSISRSAANTWNVTLDTGESLQANCIILATPAHMSAMLLASFDADLASALQNIPYVSTATISLAYSLRDVPRELDGYGYVIPRREGRKALACTWTSTKFPHRAPTGYALIRVFVGRAGQDIPWKEYELLELAKEELKLTLGVTAEPLLSRVFMWDKAMPQYNLGHPQILKRIDGALQSHSGLALAGNGYRGIGIPDCIHSGELAIEKVMRDLSREPVQATEMSQHI